MTSETPFADGKLSLKVREIASPLDDAMVTATGTLKSRSSSKTKATAHLTAVDHGNDLDEGELPLGVRRAVVSGP